MKKVMIIGGNLAGLNCALSLDLKKYSVTVIDKSKNPGTKVCAAGVSAKGDKYIPKKFHMRDFNRMLIKLGKHKVVIDRKHRILHTIDREAYIKDLIKKCKKKGIKIVLGENVKVNDISKSDVKGMHYDILIGADGYNSVVRKKLGLKSKYHTIIEAKTKKDFKDIQVIIDGSLLGYFWIFPNKGYTSIGCGTKVSVFKQWCKKLKLDYYEPKGAKLQYNYCGYKFGNQYLTGEAAGFASGLTGEGIYYAIISGIALAEELNSGVKSKRLKRLARQLGKHTIF